MITYAENPMESTKIAIINDLRKRARYKVNIQNSIVTSLAVQWLRLHLPMQRVQVRSLVGEQIPHASWPKNQNIKRKQHCNKFNKDFKSGPHQKNLLKKPQLYFHILAIHNSK